LLVLFVVPSTLAIGGDFKSIYDGIRRVFSGAPSAAE